MATASSEDPMATSSSSAHLLLEVDDEDDLGPVIFPASPSSHSLSLEVANVEWDKFHCFEYLFLLDADTQPEVWRELARHVLQEKRPGNSNADLTPVQLLIEKGLVKPDQDLWYLLTALRCSWDKIEHFVRECGGVEAILDDPFPDPGPALLPRYLETFRFTEMRLDSIGSGMKRPLPVELFRCCPQLKVLSLRSALSAKKNLSRTIGTSTSLPRQAKTRPV